MLGRYSYSDTRTASDIGFLGLPACSAQIPSAVGGYTVGGYTLVLVRALVPTVVLRMQRRRFAAVLLSAVMPAAVVMSSSAVAGGQWHRAKTRPVVSDVGESPCLAKQSSNSRRHAVALV